MSLRRSDIETVRNSVLFAGLEPSEFGAVLPLLSASVEKFKKDSVIYSPAEYRSCTGIILSGTAVARRPGGMLMSTLSPGGVFGIPVLFSPRPFPTEIKAKTDCRALFIDRALFDRLSAECPGFNRNFITLLSEKIMFLNERLDSLSSPDIKAKLKSYLLKQSCESRSDTFTLPVSVSDLASLLSTGRTSVYRSFDELTAEGFLSRSGKMITLLRKG